MSESQQTSLAAAFLKGSLSRREFLDLFFKVSVGATIGSALGCVRAYRSGPPELDAAQNRELHLVLDLIFPSEANAPGAEEIHAHHYLHLVLLDPSVSTEEKELIQNGLLWLNEESEKIFQQTFSSLSAAQQQRAMEKVAATSWGERWIATLLRYLFEALLADPIYGGNPNGIGWKWLEHTPGAPQPGEHNRYPKLIT